MQKIYSGKDIKIGDTLELTFLLGKSFTLKGEVVGNKNTFYGIKFDLPDKNDNFSVLSKNYSKFVSIIISNATH